MHRLLTHLSFKAKLILMLAVPLIAITIFAAGDTLTRVRLSGELDRTAMLARLTTDADTLVHELQKERGLSAAYLGSNASEALILLRKQRIKTDAASKSYADTAREAGTAASDDGPRGVTRAMQAIEKKLEGVAALRQSIERRALPVDEAIETYSALNEDLLGLSMQAIRITTSVEAEALLLSRFYFSWEKELAGRERAVLSNAFARDEFPPGMYVRFVRLLEAQSTYEKLFADYASPELQTIREAHLRPDVLGAVSRYEEIAVRNPGGRFAVPAGEWFQTASEKIDGMAAVEEQIHAQVLDVIELLAGDAHAAILWNSAITFVSLLTAILLGALISRNITTRMHGTIEEIQEIVNGNLTVRTRSDAGDELGVLGGGLNQLVERMHEILKEIAAASLQIENSSQQLTEASATLSSGTEQTSTQSQSIASAAVEMNQTLATLADAINEFSASIAEMASRSAEAASIAHEAQEAVHDSKTRVQLLADEAEQIGTVIQTIASGADQTRLLALNASIEAERAGDAGKGFAVVAATIKELARQSAVSSEGIKERLMAIQQNTQETAGSMLRITNIITKLNEINASIAAAVEEQSMTAREVAANVSSTSVASNEIAGSISEISSATEAGAREAVKSSNQATALLDLSKSLNSIVRSFQI